VPRHAGQASAEYVAALLLVAIVLAGAGAAVAHPPLAQAVAHHIRLGICVVWGDVCRDADARAAGLAPCTLAERSEAAGRAVSVAIVRFGRRLEWALAERSDGSVVVTRTSGGGAGVTAGAGADVSALGVRAGVDGHVEARFAAGASWELPSRAAARPFLAAVSRGDDPPLPPTEEWREGGAELGATAGVSGEVPLVPGRLGAPDAAGVDATLRNALGRRTRGGRTTWYLKAEAVPPHLFAEIAGSRASAPASREAVVEYTTDARGPAELRLLATAGAGGEVTELSSRLDLHDPANRGAAAAVLGALPSLSGARTATDALAARMASHGVVERATYAVATRDDGWALTGRFGFALGAEVERTSTRRRLVAADAWIHGSRRRERFDCLGAGAA
jgi:hypothetical protein